MQNQKSKITYWVNGETVTEQEFINLTGEYFKYFEGSDVKAVDYSSVESLFDGDYKSQRQINNHLQSVLGGYKKPNVKINSTRHKAREEGKFHQYPLAPEECFLKDDIITSSNRGEKEMMEKFKEITIPFNNGSEQMKVRVCSPQCFCDGSCKKEIKEPFSIQVPKPKAFNQSNFFDKIEQERQLRESFEKRVKELDKKEGVKETEGKKDYSEINLEILDLMAERFTANKHKYPKGNMKKPIDIKSLEWALFRHIKKMIQPIEEDTETYKDHLSAVLCNCSMILDQLNLQNQK